MRRYKKFNVTHLTKKILTNQKVLCVGRLDLNNVVLEVISFLAFIFIVMYITIVNHIQNNKR